MLAKRIIPCLDIKNGRTVKGVNFFNLKDAGDPIELAVNYSQNNADELVFLDISATEQKRKTLHDLVYEIAKSIDIPFTVGGGINSIKDVEKLLKNGADKISINSAAINDPDIIKTSSKHFGSQCIVVAVDVKKIGNEWEVFSHGGTKSTGIEAISWLKKVEELGAGEVLLTSMDRDGTKLGFDNDILYEANKILSIPVIASGGVGLIKHFYEGVIKGRADALLAASVFHFNEFSIMDVKKYLKSKNIQVRI